MSSTLKLLVIEDDASDFLLVDRRLRHEGLSAECHRVDNNPQLEEALSEEWDLVLSDYSVPGMDFRVTLDAIRARQPEVPVILVSGSVGEETAVELLHLGLSDFILKDNIARLVPSIRRTVNDRDDRRARREAEESLRRAQTAIVEEQRQARIAALNLMEDAIASRMRAEAAQTALQESEAKYRLLADNSADCIFWLGPDRRIKYISPACEPLTGHKPEEFLADSRLWVELVHPDDRPAFRAHVANVLEADDGEMEYRLVHKDGSVVFVLHHCRPIFDDDGTYLGRHGTDRDISEKKRSEAEKDLVEAQLRQAQKMESIGRLAGGVAHDFNNLLTVILGRAELLQMGEALTPQQEEDILSITEAGERAQALTQQLLMFSRKQVIQPRRMDWNEQIESSLKIYRRILGEDVTMHFRPESDLPLILADPQQLDQLLANLLVNARDAIQARTDAGRESRITISTKRAKGASRRTDLGNGSGDGDFVCLAVEDTGVGMDETTRERIFEPFFTTKAEGKGTGLGLATVFGVVKQNGGSIEVSSVPGRGSSFQVFWPASSEEDEKGSRPAQRDRRSLRGSETLLLVEDFEPLRKMCVPTLAQLGYRVLEASSAEQAEGLAKNGSPRPDLLITDVVLPGMNGRQLAEKLNETWPALPVLFISGYTSDIIAEKGILEEGVDLLEKPFGAEELARRIRSKLGRL